MSRIVQVGIGINGAPAKEGGAVVKSAFQEVADAAQTMGTTVDAATARAVAGIEKERAAMDKQGLSLAGVETRYQRLTQSKKDAEKEAYAWQKILLDEEKRLDAIIAADDRYIQQKEKAQRAMALTQIEAHKMNEAFDEQAGKINLTGLQVGQLRNELATLIGRLTGTNTAVDRVAGSLGGMALGEGAILGALLGVAALGMAYEKLTEQTRKLKKETEDAQEALHKLHVEQQQGAAGALPEQIKKATDRLVEMRKELDNISAKAALPNTMGAVATGMGGDPFASSRAADRDKYKKEYEEKLLDIKAGEKALADAIKKADAEYSNTRNQEIIDLVNYGKASAAVVAEGNARMKNLYAQANDDLKAGNQAAAILRLEQAENLKKALNPDTSRADHSAEVKAAHELHAAMLQEAHVEQTVNTMLAERNVLRNKELEQVGPDAVARLDALIKKTHEIGVAEAQRWIANDNIVSKLEEQAGILNVSREEAAKIREEEWTREAFAKNFSADQTKRFLEAHRLIQANKDAADAWKETLREISDVANLIGASLGTWGKALADAVNGGGRLADVLKQTQSLSQKSPAGLETGAGLGVWAAAGTAVFGIADALNGMIGSADKSKKKAEEMAAAYQKQAQAAQQAINATNDNADAVAKAAAQLKSAAQLSLQASLSAAAKGRDKNAADQAVQAYSDALAQIEDIVKQRTEAIKAQAAALANFKQANDVLELSIAGRDKEAAAMQTQIDIAEKVAAAVKQFGDTAEVARYKTLLLADAQKKAAEAEQAEADAAAKKLLDAQRQAQAVGFDVTARERALSGDDRGALQARSEASYASQLAAAEDMLKAGTISEELFNRMKAVLGGELAKALQQFDDAAAKAAKTLQDDLEVRRLAALGDAAGAAAKRQEIANAKELEGITDPLVIAQIKYVQGLEAEDRAKQALDAIAQKRAAQDASILSRMITAYQTLDPKKAEELTQLQQQIDRQNELAAAVDDVQRARYLELYALQDQADALAKLAKAQADAAAQAEKLANITDTVQEDYLRATGRGFDADKLVLDNERAARIKAAKDAGGDQSLLDLINATYDAKLASLIKATIDAQTPDKGVASAHPDLSTQFITSAVAQSISSQQALSLVDIGASQLVELRKIAANTASGGGNGVRIDVVVQGGAYSGTPGDVGRGIVDALLPALDQALGRRVGVDTRLAGASAL